jgi:hypothetical protein
MAEELKALTAEQRQQIAREYDYSGAREIYSAQRITNDGVDFAEVFKAGFEKSKERSDEIFQTLMSD